MATLSEALATGLAHHRAGHLDLAEEIYRRILAAEPEHAEALHLVGLVAHQRGQHQLAIEHIRRAIAVDDRQARFHCNLGEAYRALEQFDAAIACYGRALELNPQLAQAHNNLGEAYRAQGRLDEAIASYRRALELAPGTATAHNNLGIALEQRGRLDEAVACYRRAIELEPSFAAAYTNLAGVCRELGRLDEAAACCRHALQCAPNSAEVYGGLGSICAQQGKFADAATCYQRAAELAPELAETHSNLGGILQRQGRLDEAVARCRRAIELQPNLAEAYTNLGNAWKDQGRLADALLCYRRAVELRPDDAAAHSNLVYTLLFSPDCDAQTLDEELRLWSRRHAEPLADTLLPHDNDRSPERRLRVGYVSPDLRNHVVGRNLLPLLGTHDHQQFEVFCYADVTCPDALTEQLRSCADAWRPTAGLHPAQLARQVRDDQVDILVDLALHMDGNRLLTFARRPAPVQVTFAGYPGATGLATIDYRLTDPHLDPPGAEPPPDAEQPIRLPDSFWCYAPGPEDPAPNPLPALTHGAVTFGCLANLCKVNDRVLKLWARVLRAVDRSQLVLLASEGSHRQRIRDLLAAEGVSPEQVEFLSGRPRGQYLTVYHRIDVGLDTFPYNGHNTSLDSLWMGVPVVTLAGQAPVGRAGLSILSNVGLPELVACNVEQYLRIAVDLSKDLPRLTDLRAGLRERMQRSPLCNAPRFARSVESAYRTMWRRWCERAPKRTIGNIEHPEQTV
jgi:predicted O-linked N-acetylglucosamine transferase (SPINDLY family)